MADEPEEQAPEAGAGVEARVDSLESKVDQILGILGGGGKPASDDDQQKPEPGPANVAEEIRQQLDERDRRNAAAADQQTASDRLGALETRVSELAEKPPETMPRRVEKLMGWR